jgi:hypothetical protein
MTEPAKPRPTGLLYAALEFCMIVFGDIMHLEEYSGIPANSKGDIPAKNLMDLEKTDQ